MGFFRKLLVLRKIKKAIDSGDDVWTHVENIQARYADLPDDVKESWDKVKAFAKDVRDVF